MADSGLWWTFGSLAFALLMIGIIVWPVTSIWKSRGALSKEREYRELSDRSVRSLEGSERELVALRSTMATLNGRVEVLERMLAEVD
jgi:flagellar biogenesis protein FliO